MVARTGPWLFSKPLTATDLEHRLHWPSEQLKLLPDFNGSHQVEFVVKDVNGQRLKFKCSKRMTGTYDKPVISSGWVKFLSAKPTKFKPGDEVIFYKSVDADADFEIRVRRKVLLFGTNINDVEE